MRRCGAARRNRPTPILHVDMDAFFVSVELLDAAGVAGQSGDCRRRPGQAGRGDFGELRGAKIWRAFGDGAAHRGETLPACDFSAQAITNSTANGAIAWRRFLRNFRRLWKWRRSMRRISTFPGRSGCTGRRSPPRINCLREITATTSLPCSGGLASTRLVAKIASDQAKPRGLVWVAPGSEAKFLGAACRCGGFPASGKLRMRRCAILAIETVEQLQALSVGEARGDIWKVGHGALPEGARNRFV